MEERKVEIERNRVSPHFLHFLANSFGVAQLKLARCPHSLTASLAATPVRLGPLLYLPRRSIREGGSLIPFAPFVEVAADLKRTTSAATLKLDCLNQSSSQRPAKEFIYRKRLTIRRAKVGSPNFLHFSKAVGSAPGSRKIHVALHAGGFPS